jgi:hypothetical protein
VRRLRSFRVFGRNNGYRIEENIFRFDVSGGGQVRAIFSKQGSDKNIALKLMNEHSPVDNSTFFMKMSNSMG